MTRKLNPKDLELFKSNLLRARAVLSGDVRHLEQEALGGDGMPVDSEGPGEDGYFQEFSLELLERDEQTLREIDEALDRIELGSYGHCEVCEAPIGKSRLQAVPHARNCIDCQRKAEGGGR